MKKLWAWDKQRRQTKFRYCLSFPYNCSIFTDVEFARPGNLRILLSFPLLFIPKKLQENKEKREKKKDIFRILADGVEFSDERLCLLVWVWLLSLDIHDIIFFVLFNATANNKKTAGFEPAVSCILGIEKVQRNSIKITVDLWQHMIIAIRFQMVSQSFKSE